MMLYNMSCHLSWSVRNSEEAALSVVWPGWGQGAGTGEELLILSEASSGVPDWNPKAQVPAREIVMAISPYDVVQTFLPSPLDPSFTPHLSAHLLPFPTVLSRSPCCLSWPTSHLTASKHTSHHQPQSPRALKGYSEQFSSVGNIIIS